MVCAIRKRKSASCSCGYSYVLACVCCFLAAIYCDSCIELLWNLESSMNTLPPLPSRYRSWTEFYLEVERELKKQGATYAPHGMDGAELLKWLEDPKRVCQVPNDFEVEFRYQVIPYDESRVCLKMRDVKLKVFEEAMEVLRERETLIELKYAIRVHLPPTHPIYDDFQRIAKSIVEIT